jgi:hypothetical protein
VPSTQQGGADDLYHFWGGEDISVVIIDGKALTVDVTKGATTVAAASLLHVLEGTIVVTKAPAAYVHPFSHWIQYHGASKGNDFLLGVTATNSRNALNLALLFAEWREAILSSPELRKDGNRQLAQVALAVSLLREKARCGLDVDTASLDTI